MQTVFGQNKSNSSFSLPLHRLFFEIQLWLTEGYFYFFIFILWFGLHFLDCALAFYSL